MKETRFNIIRAKLPYLSFAERLLVKSFLFGFKNLIMVENEENLLLADDPVIYSFNHNNYLETLLVSFYLIFQRGGKKISFVIDWMYGRLPFLSWLFNKIEPIYVYNKRAKLAVINRQRKILTGTTAYEECVARLKKQQSIGIFPEGTRNNNPLFLKRGRKGVGAMVLASEAAVVPIGIIFPHRPQRGWLSPLRTMTIRIGKPMRFAPELARAREMAANPALAPGKSRRWSTLLAARITHRLMEALARLSGKRYPFPAPEAFP